MRKLNPRATDIPFALGHTYLCRRKSILATLIPKNASSLIKAAFAWYDALPSAFDEMVANAFSDVHVRFDGLLTVKNIYDLDAATKSLVVLRCPYRRAASAFLDKFVAAPEEAIVRGIVKTTGKNVADITFQDFVYALVMSPDYWLDTHFRSQSSYISLDDYDHYFCVEDHQPLSAFLDSEFGEAIAELKKAAPEGINREQLPRVPVDGAWKMTARDLTELRRSNGVAPQYRSLYTDALISDLFKRYRDDIEMYISRTSGKLLFD